MPITYIYILSLHDALPISVIAELDVLATFAVVAKRFGYTRPEPLRQDRKSTRLNSSHVEISYAVFCLKKKMSERAARSLVLLSANFIARERRDDLVDLELP